MKNESEIRKRIEELSNEIKQLFENPNTDSYLIQIDKKKKQLRNLDEITHLCWVLEEPVSKTLFDMIA